MVAAAVMWRMAGVPSISAVLSGPVAKLIVVWNGLKRSVPLLMRVSWLATGAKI